MQQAKLELVHDEETRFYDESFFGTDDGGVPPMDAFDHLEAASTNLAFFSHEAQSALESIGLTGDQRLEIAQILVFIQDLGRRFDRVRVPGFERATKRSSDTRL